MSSMSIRWTRRRALRALPAASMSMSMMLPMTFWMAAPARARAAAAPDADLVDRHGRAVKLRRDVWADRVALVNFVFTTCTSFCGVQSAMLAQMQRRLGARMGRDVVLISLSIDPLSDTPDRLRAFAHPFEPGPHWWWLTGEARTVFATLDALGADRGDPRGHAPLWLVGKADAPRRIVGQPSMAQLEAALDNAAQGLR